MGQTLSVSVLVSAEGSESLNGVSSRIEYPTDKLTLLSLSKAGSIITFWAEEPSFSNSAGTASIDGIVPNPGFSGQGGRVVTLVFQVKAPGTATLSFRNASVLANDGRGTNILSSATSRTLTLAAAAPPPLASVVTRPTPAPAPLQEEPIDTVATVTAPTSTTPQPGFFDNPPRPAAIEIARTLVFVFAGIGIAALVIAGLETSRTLLARRKRLRSTDVVRRSFALLKSDLKTHIQTLKKEPHTPLSEVEVAFLDQFEKDLEDVESIVRTKLKTGE